MFKGEIAIGVFAGGKTNFVFVLLTIPLTIAVCNESPRSPQLDQQPPDPAATADMNSPASLLYAVTATTGNFRIHIDVYKDITTSNSRYSGFNTKPSLY